MLIDADRQGYGVGHHVDVRPAGHSHDRLVADMVREGSRPIPTRWGQLWTLRTTLIRHYYACTRLVAAAIARASHKDNGHRTGDVLYPSDLVRALEPRARSTRAALLSEHKGGPFWQTCDQLATALPSNPFWCVAMASRAETRKLASLLRAEARRTAHAHYARRRARAVLSIIKALQRNGATTASDIAAALNARDVPTQSGRGRWHAASVRRVIAVAGRAMSRA
jgi:hypothetical protein